MEFELGRVDFNPFRDMKRNPPDEDHVKELVQSITDETFWENVVGRVVEVDGEKRLQLAHGNVRLLALRRVYKNKLTTVFDWRTRDLSDGAMIRSMVTENRTQGGGVRVQNLLEGVRAIVAALGDGRITEDEIEIPEGGKDLKYAPSFLTSPESGTQNKRRYTSKSLAIFFGMQR